MSVSTALSNALSGLDANARRAEVVSDNVANALVDGYAGRDVRLATRGVSGGVEVVGLARRGDPQARSRLRLAEADVAGSDALAAARERLSAAVGGPDDPGSLAARATAFEVALSRLVDTPESAALQADTAAEAAATARAFNAASTEVVALRGEADAAIDRLTGEANKALLAVERLNAEIRRAEVQGGVAARELPALQDDRDGWIDRLAEIVPIRTARRDFGEIAIYAPGGAVLLEGRAQTFGFSRASALDPASSVGAGGLSAVTLGGSVIDAGSTGPLAGGELSAQVAVRDEIGPEMQTRLDAIAADLMQRFEAPGLDATRAPGSPGLFTDAGAVYDPADVVGLSARLALSAEVDPAVGGEPRRLRDGLGAAAPGPAGDPTLARALLDTLTADRPAPPGSGLSRDGGAAGFAGGLSGLAAEAAGRAEADAALARGRRVGLAEAEAVARGVDVDAELADLLVVEQAYAANARVVSVADDLLRTLLEI